MTASSLRFVFNAHDNVIISFDDQHLRTKPRSNCGSKIRISGARCKVSSVQFTSPRFCFNCYQEVSVLYGISWTQSLSGQRPSH